MIKITINGTSKEISGINHVEDLVRQFCTKTNHVIAEINGTIIPSTDWQKTPVNNGDTIELVSFVGGG